MEIARILPILVEFGIGAALCVVGVWCGVSSGYLDLRDPRDQRIILMIVGGFAGLLLFYGAFTFWLPYLPEKAASP
jgi:hypothetical protein